MIITSQKKIFYKCYPLEHMTNTTRNKATSSTIGLIKTKANNINITINLEV
jgi:hypothetical protein